MSSIVPSNLRVWQYDTSDSQTNFSESFDVGSRSDRALHVFIIAEDTSDVASDFSLTYNGVSLTDHETATDSLEGDAVIAIHRYRLDAPASGLNTLAITGSGANIVGVVAFAASNESAAAEVVTGEAAGTQNLSDTTSTVTSDNLLLIVWAGYSTSNLDYNPTSGDGTVRFEEQQYDTNNFHTYSLAITSQTGSGGAENISLDTTAGNWSSACWMGISITPNATLTLPDGDASIDSDDHDHDSTTVSFSTTDTNATGYESDLNYTSVEDEGDPSPLEYDRTSLSAETGYVTRVRPYTSDGPGWWSDPYSFTTDAAPVTTPQVGTPVNLTIEDFEVSGSVDMGATAENKYLVVGVIVSPASAGSPAVEYNSVSMTEDANSVVTLGNQTDARFSIFYLDDPSDGSNTLNIDGGSAQNISAIAIPLTDGCTTHRTPTGDTFNPQANQSLTGITSSDEGLDLLVSFGFGFGFYLPFSSNFQCDDAGATETTGIDGGNDSDPDGSNEAYDLRAAYREATSNTESTQWDLQNDGYLEAGIAAISLVGVETLDPPDATPTVEEVGYDATSGWLVIGFSGNDDVTYQISEDGGAATAINYPYELPTLTEKTTYSTGYFRIRAVKVGGDPGEWVDVPGFTSADSALTYASGIEFIDAGGCGFDSWQHTPQGSLSGPLDAGTGADRALVGGASTSYVEIDNDLDLEMLYNAVGFTEIVRVDDEGGTRHGNRIDGGAEGGGSVHVLTGPASGGNTATCEVETNPGSSHTAMWWTLEVFQYIDQSNPVRAETHWIVVGDDTDDNNRGPVGGNARAMPGDLVFSHAGAYCPNVNDVDPAGDGPANPTSYDPQEWDNQSTGSQSLDILTTDQGSDLVRKMVVGTVAEGAAASGYLIADSALEDTTWNYGSKWFEVNSVSLRPTPNMALSVTATETGTDTGQIDIATPSLLNEYGRLLWMVVDSGDTPPTASEIQQWVNSQSGYAGGTVRDYGELVPSSGGSQIDSLSGLSAGTTYDVYVTFERPFDTPLGNVVSDSFTTLDTIQTNVDTLEFTEYQANISLSITIQTNTDTLEFTEYPATVNAETSITTVTDTLEFTEYQSDINLDRVVTTIIDGLEFTEYPATVNAETNIQANTDTLELTTYPATVNAELNFTTVTDTLEFTEYQANINTGINIETVTDTLEITEYQATITSNIDIQTNVDTFEFTEYQIDVNLNKSVSSNVDTLELTEYQAGISFDKSVNTNVDTLEFTEYQATVNTETSITTVTDTLEFTEYQATITLDTGTNIQANTDTLELTTYASEISASFSRRGGAVSVYRRKGYLRRKKKQEESLYDVEYIPKIKIEDSGKPEPTKVEGKPAKIINFPKIPEISKPEDLESESAMMQLIEILRLQNKNIEKLTKLLESQNQRIDGIKDETEELVIALLQTLN